MVAPDGVIRAVNRQVEELFGYGRAELVGQPVEMLMPAHHQAGHERHLRSYFTAPSARPMGVCTNIVGRTKGGRMVPLDVSLSPVPTAEGTMAAAAVRDITERRKAEEALQASERRFREFMEHAELVCITLDREARIVFCNQFLLSLTGRRRDEVEGRNWFELFIPAEDHERIKEVFGQSLAREAIPVPPNFENPILTRTGERRLIAWNNVLVHDAAGGVIGITAVGNDVTEQRRAQAALEAAKAEAERANALKSRFLAATSHDLRQPLQTLGLLQGVLSRTVRDPGSRGVIQNLGDTIASMASTIDALLDINQLESGAIAPEVIDFPASGILNRVRSEYDHVARTKGLELRVVACSAVIRSDPRLLGRLVDNLVANAIKYTEAGKVLIGCRRRGEALRIEVRDTGVGIPDDQLETIFEEYHQLDNPARQRSRGLGLGLTVVQRMAELLGHRIDVHSTLGRGSMFAVEVVLGHSRGEAARAEAPQTAAAGDGISVLLVEDDPSVRESLSLLLDLEGCEVATAASAHEALAMVAQGAVRPRVVIADRNLPDGISGTGLVDRLSGRFDQEIPAIVMTGDASDEARREIVESGAAYLLKPVDAGKLVELIERLARGRGESRATERPARREPPVQVATKKAEAPVIAVADDDPTIRSAIRSLLAASGYEAETFATCEPFLARDRPERSACLLVDIGMPGMDGLELQERLNAQGEDIPLIVITGRKDVPLAVQAMRAGAVDFLQKPFTDEALLRAIERALAHRAESADRAQARRRLERLTAREREVMALLVAGCANKEVALRLGISPRTAENHRARIMHKTDVDSLAELVRLAMAAGISTADRPDRASLSSLE